MNTKHLKTRILDLALQGKLVENSKISEKSNFRIPTDFKPPFGIPNSWQWVKLEEVCNGSSAKLTLKELKQSGKFKVFGATGLVGYLDTFDKENSCIAIIKDGAGVGRVQILPPKSSALATMQYIENKENIIKLEFLARILIWLNLGKTFNGSAIPHIYFRNYKNFYIPLPPLDEQERIVKKIDELFSQIDILETSKQSLLKNIKHTKTRILDLALQGKLVENSRIPTDLNSRIPTDFNPPFKIPNYWAWVKLGDICEISSGGTPSRNEAEFWENGTIPWLKIADIKDDYVNSSSEFITQKGLENSSAKIFKKGTLLFTIFATLGEVAILNIDASTNQAIVGLTPKKDNYITKFIFFALKNIKNSVNLIGRGATQKNINQTILKNLYIPLPPLDEQERIVKKIDELFEILEVIENSL
ncbi:MAG: restriction endonuclease subunit S [Campylobacter sp.]|nr:restriction endonuclease subunit S [Campylobacter sp.]